MPALILAMRFSAMQRRPMDSATSCTACAHVPGSATHCIGSVLRPQEGARCEADLKEDGAAEQHPEASEGVERESESSRHAAVQSHAKEQAVDQVPSVPPCAAGEAQRLVTSAGQHASLH